MSTNLLFSAIDTHVRFGELSSPSQSNEHNQKTPQEHTLCLQVICYLAKEIFIGDTVPQYLPKKGQSLSHVIVTSSYERSLSKCNGNERQVLGLAVFVCAPEMEVPVITLCLFSFPYYSEKSVSLHLLSPLFSLQFT